MGKFLPPLDDSSPLTRQSVSDIALLSFQVNIFRCGGVVIGCYFLHKLLDIVSISIFFQYWAAVASKRYDDLVEPDFGATVAAFPPQVVLGKDGAGDGVVNDADADTDNDTDTDTDNASPGSGSEKDDDFMKIMSLRFKNIKVVCKSFKFDNKAVKSLKTKAISETLPYTSSFQVVAGFLWQQIMAATSNKQSVPTMLIFSANVRAKTRKPLPKAAVGNAIATLVVCAEKSEEQFPYYVNQIHATLSTLGEKVKTMQAEKATETFIAAQKAGSRGFRNVKPNSCVHLSSWSKFGFYDVDFGFGKPTKVIPMGNIHPLQRNCIVFLDYKDEFDGDGIEVWLFMEEKEMQVLEAETTFLEYALPS